MNENERALVVGGGGAAGHAWAIAVIAGLYEAGLDVTNADLFVGTSSGATVAAHVTGGVRPNELLGTILAEPVPRPAAGRADAGAALRASGRRHMETTGAIIAAAADAADMRRRLGAAALEPDAALRASKRTQWRATVASRLASQEWPGQHVRIVAVDAATGEPVVFDRASGVDLVDAVAASSGNGYSIGSRTYINGAYRRNENADLAAGYRRVLVLSPFGGRTRHPLEWGMQLSAQVDELHAGGSRVETVFPDSSIEHLFDAGALDPATRLPAAHGGYSQGRAVASRVADIWR
jgi:NTE family protein